jgi:hypothetical protein
MTVTAREFQTLRRIADSPTFTITAQNLADHFGAAGKKLLEIGALIQVGSRNDTESMTDHEGKSVEVVRHDGKNAYFSPTAGWVNVPAEDLLLYGACPVWLTNLFKTAVGIEAHVEPKPIVEQKAWLLGDVWLKKVKSPIILVMHLRREQVFSSVKAYLEQNHNKRPALLIALDSALPAHLSLPAQNRVITIDEAIDMNEEKFVLRLDLMAERMGASISQQGFSEGYRTAFINGVKYKFTVKQAEAIQYMIESGKPVHQDEITAEISPNAKTRRLISYFRSGNNTHPAWGVIVKGDNSGNFWLEY